MRSRGGSSSSRIGLFDVIRGFSVISMVAFHLCYDLKYLYGYDLAWFASPLREVWRCSIAWTFLVIAGWMCSLSRSNVRRGGAYSAVALAIWGVTSLAGVDTAISFGIIFCMGASTLLYALLEALGLQPRGFVAAIVLLALFLLLLDVPKGTVGLGPLRLQVPDTLYQTEWLSWLGFPGSTFSSGDYYPLLPYSLLYLAGAAAGSLFGASDYPAWVRNARAPLLSLAGRHALAIYVVHQPLILLVCQLLTAGIT